MPGLVVQKYGGTSVGTPAKIVDVAARISRLRRQGENVVVVVSAMGHTTDELIALAQQVSQALPDREMDMLLSAGERISMALLSMALKDQGLNAISFTGSQAGIITDDSHTRARILDIKPFRVLDELAKGRVVIVAGFQGVSRQKEVTTLGRGGSDTTAVALAAALKADRCEVFTDVRGIFSADPRKVTAARFYPKLPLDLVYEMSVQGAQVMHARSVEIARERQMALWVGPAHFRPEDANQRDAAIGARSSQSEVGTMIVSPKEISVSELPRVVAIAPRAGLLLHRIPADQAAQCLADLSRERVILHDLQANADGSLVFLIDPLECQAFLKQRNLTGAQGVSTIALVGYQLQQEASLTAAVLETLASLGIRPLHLTAHPQSIKVWLPDPSHLDLAVQALHARLIAANPV